MKTDTILRKATLSQTAESCMLLKFQEFGQRWAGLTEDFRILLHGQNKPAHSVSSSSFAEPEWCVSFLWLHLEDKEDGLKAEHGSKSSQFVRPYVLTIKNWIRLHCTVKEPASGMVVAVVCRVWSWVKSAVQMMHIDSTAHSSLYISRKQFSLCRYLSGMHKHIPATRIVIVTIAQNRAFAR